MKNFILVLMLLALHHSVLSQSKLPDLSNKDDLAALGEGKIFETDNTTIRDIQIFEIKEFWLVYIKNNSLHDILFDKIMKIEFPNSKWGKIYIVFINKKPVVRFY